MPDFTPGLKFCELFYHEAVKPILEEEFPGLKHSAALLGYGSEILGFDDHISTDHCWGPRLLLFLEESDCDHLYNSIYNTLAQKLPREFRGYETGFNLPEEMKQPPVPHHVQIWTCRGFILRELNFDIYTPLEPADWLICPQQALLQVTAGAVYHDAVGLQAVRNRFTWYPGDVWLYLMIAGWARVGQEQHLMGRAGFVGDEMGSTLIGARLVRDLMRLCFLMEKQYAPYPKWFGTAFSRLHSASQLSPLLRSALAASTWQDREKPLAVAYEVVAAMHDSLDLGPPLHLKAMLFYGRPFQVINTEMIIETLRARITDPAVKRLIRSRPIGSIDQFSDSTDLLCDSGRRRKLRALYESGSVDQFTV